MNVKKTLFAATIALTLGGWLNFVHGLDSNDQPQKPKTLTKSWQSVDGGLNGPESVIHDSLNHVIYASNINP
jgi:hypothetical protein